MVLEYDADYPRPRRTIGCLTYQSRASTRPTQSDLDALVARARIRNKQHGVTGMLLYEGGRFLQTLEGPPEDLDTIWSSIQRDERHSDITVLTHHLVSSRLFSDWSLLLYRKFDEAPSGFLRKLRRKDPLSERISKVVHLAFDADQSGLNTIIESLTHEGWHGDEVVRGLLEPAARALGDAWLADDCSEFDLTLALGLLQRAGHLARYSSNLPQEGEQGFSVLLATAPGEPHLFGPSLLADQLTDAGWAVEVSFLDSNEALASQLYQMQPDMVDISLSDALPRHGGLAALRETVRHSRHSVPEAPPIVSVGGRLFAEGEATAEHVGADYARRSIAGVTRAMAKQISQARKIGLGKLP